jgi:hypothetical protein
MKKLFLVLSIFFIGTLHHSHAQTTLIAASSSWKYLANGSNQGTAWRANSFSDASWSTGNAELGYGDGGEATVISYGTSSKSKYVTSYFRKSFSVSDPTIFSSLSLNLLRDDGAVVYLNGTEVARSNMPSGTISYTTFASSTVGTSSENLYHTFVISPTLLISGTNLLAVEVHQITRSSPDLSFNCYLTASTIVTPPALITRGPYLQMLSSTGILVRWRTNVATNSRVYYGTSTNYGSFKNDALVTTEHKVQLTGLTPGTKYFYSIGTSTFTLQGDMNNFFKTAPLTGSTAPLRIWATGDFGTGTTSQADVRDAFASYTASSPADFWVWMGDNAYASGYDGEYQSKVFDMYPNQFKNIPVYPCLGNHDYANAGYQSSTSLGLSFPYFSIFSVPTSGEIGGVASATPKYYSYNVGNLHLIALDSYGSLNTPGSAMYNWLQNDLAANSQTWTVVYFHHPPYSKGTHNSDTEIEMINMRQNIVPLLETYKVDLVLNGHSHSNERSYLMKGHLGLANTFVASMKMSTSSSNFVKAPPYNGTVYAVCGTSGQNPGGTSSGWPMACMSFNNNSDYASLVIDVNGSSFNCKYLAASGNIVDQFTITKTTSTTENNFKVYQNDSQVIFNFNQAEDEVADLTIYNIEGKLVHSLKSVQLNAKFPLVVSLKNSQISKGIYIVEVATKSKRMTQKMFLDF